jgi:hypothetical protein
VLLALGAGLTGCQTSMTQMTSPKALEPGRPEVAVNMNGVAHTSVVTKTIQGGKNLLDKKKEGEEPVTEGELRDILDATLAWALFRPGFGPEAIVRLGVTDAVLEGMDAGIRYNGSLIKGDLKLQLWESSDGMHALAVDLGYAYHIDVVSSVLEYITLTDFSRHDIDLSVSWGMEWRDIIKVYLSPRVIGSRVSVDHKIPDWLRNRIPEDIQKLDPNQFFRDEWMWYTGVTWGLMAGYKYVFLCIDVSAFYLHFTPEVLFEERDMSSWALSPAIGLVATF